ncbi:hypothetical protein FB45DRAFT_355644 [Roridomyces roridus]|uniref:Uncharacterized protein n=1 Tax=Roridomyces roridus TaxID=1738132 RepID=A0AAD7C7R4_9AGAR|nr:hypothetical protein FB45DRAFT_355644 [Roridomyces roridus]
MTDWEFLQLTPFDKGCDKVVFTNSWLVQGSIDTRKLSAALDIVTDRWRLLAGRLEQGAKPNTWRVRYPKGDIPKDHRRYALTTATSDASVSDYVTLPLPIVSPHPPISLTMAPSTPKSARGYATSQHPIISIHITTLSDNHSFVGFTIPHGVFDATGMAFVHQVVDAEFSGREWTPPMYPNALSEALEAHAVQPSSMSFYYKVTTFSKFVGRCLYDTFWHGITARLVVVPEAVHLGLVKQVRDSLDIPVTSSDILAAWLFKTLCSRGPANRSLRLLTYSSFRPFFPNMATYPHNAFMRVWYPQTTAGELAQRSLSELALIVYQTRQALGQKDALAAHDDIASGSLLDIMAQGGDCKGAGGTFWVNNCSAQRSPELTWPGVDTVNWASRYLTTDTGIEMSDALTIMGRLNGDLMIHITVSNEKLAVLQGEIERLVSEGFEK